jgi:conjugal transfer pilus assembly protein TraW
VVRFLGLLSLLCAALPAYTKDFGVHGTTYPIEEQDLLVLIESKLRSMDPKTLEAHQEAVKKKMVESVRRPRPVKGITKAIATKKRYFDPSFTVEEDIFDGAGQLLHAKGTKINPLERINFLESWIFIDGDDEDQKNFALEEAKRHPKSKIILVQGTPGAQEEGVWFYFDQGGDLCRRMGIESVPTIVQQDESQPLISLREIGLEKKGAKS